ncbi:MAG: hypothetical protein HYX74_11015 [Acidobacteria bacterium]|nr:hypothetical protein [Acidobacteriota bacterium]
MAADPFLPSEASNSRFDLRIISTASSVASTMWTVDQLQVVRVDQVVRLFSSMLDRIHLTRPSHISPTKTMGRPEICFTCGRATCVTRADVRQAFQPDAEIS